MCDLHSRGEDLVTYTSPELLADRLTITGQADTIIPFNSHATNLVPPPSFLLISTYMMEDSSINFYDTISHLKWCVDREKNLLPPYVCIQLGFAWEKRHKGSGEGRGGSLRGGRASASIGTDKVNVNVNAISVVTFVCVCVCVCVCVKYELWVMGYELWAMSLPPSPPCFLFVHTYVIRVLGCYSAPLALPSALCVCMALLYFNLI